MQPTPQGCPIDMEERRRDGDRIVRLETVVDRIETDVKTLTTTYKEIAAQQQVMFVENLKSQGALQSAIQEMTRTMQDQKPRVDELEDNCHVVRAETAKIAALETKVGEHERWKWKITGGVIALTALLQFVGWLFK